MRSFLTCNRYGTNVATGVASSLIADSTFFGKPKKDLAVFELDERSSPRILPFIKPDIPFVHQHLPGLLQAQRPRGVHLGDFKPLYPRRHPAGPSTGTTCLCATLKESNPRVYFSIDPLPGEPMHSANQVAGPPACPRCGGPLQWEWRRYHHIGRARCQACGLASPQPQYRLTAVDQEKRLMTVCAGELPGTFPFPNGNIINLYNALSAVAVLSEYGLSREKIAQGMGQLAIAESRYKEDLVGGRRVIFHLAKGMNPIACSQACRNAQNAPGKKAVLLFMDDFHEAAHSVENIAWIYDTDFEFLNDPGIVQVIEAGPRHWDTYVRLLIAGVPREKIVHGEDNPGGCPGPGRPRGGHSGGPLRPVRGGLGGRSPRPAAPAAFRGPRPGGKGGPWP